MSVNLTALAPITTTATALSNLVLVTPQSVTGYQPQNPNNADGLPSTAARPPTFVFDYEGEQAVMLESDITDHYVENNIAVEDQIALKPVLYTTRGFVGELNDVVPAFLKPVKVIADKLTTIGGYVPGLTTTALLAYSEAFFLYQVGANAINSAVAAWSSIANFGTSAQSVIGSSGLTVGRLQNKQQIAFQTFYGYWNEKRLFSVQTPWAVFEDMAIVKLKANQDSETRVITDIEITFKMIRKASTLTQLGSFLGDVTSFQSRAGSQASSPTNLGTTSGTPSIPLSEGLSNMAVA